MRVGVHWFFGSGKEGKRHRVVGLLIGPTPTLAGSTVQKLLGPFHAWGAHNQYLFFFIIIFQKGTKYIIIVKCREGQGEPNRESRQVSTPIWTWTVVAPGPTNPPLAF